MAHPVCAFGIPDKFMKIVIKLAAFVVMLAASACGNQPSPAPTSIPTNTPDMCSSKNVPIEVDRVHKLMREFDDASLLGTNTPRDQLPPVISDMQRIRRAAEDQIVPACLATLKNLQLIHMNTVINTLVAFLGGADQSILGQGAELARRQHNNYALEYARLLGLTVVVLPTPTLAAAETRIPVVSPTASVSVINPGPSEINLYSEPSVNSTVVGVIMVNQSLTVVDQNPERTWFKVEIPGQPGQFAWLEARSVNLSNPSP